MKQLLKIFERLRPNFDEKGRFRLFKPLFQATEGFFFSSPELTENAPHARDALDVKRYMSVVIVALIPALAASLIFFGLRVLVMIVVSYIAGGVVEVLVAIIRKEEINEGFLVTGLIFPLILPPTLPLWMVAVGVAFGVLVGKELFGGTGRNLFNPAIVGRCFLAIGYPAQMGIWIKPGQGFLGRLFEYAGPSSVDAVTSATPLALAKQGILTPLEHLVTGRIAGSAGETSAIAIIIGGVFLLLTRVANWRTTVGILGSFGILGFALGRLSPDNFGPVGWHLFAGGLLFGAFFMATDPVSSPITSGGKWFYGILIGGITLLIRNLTGYVEGVMFAILLGNIMAPVLDEIVVQMRIRRLQYEG